MHCCKGNPNLDRKFINVAEKTNYRIPNLRLHELRVITFAEIVLEFFFFTYFSHISIIVLYLYGNTNLLSWYTENEICRD